MCFQLEVCFEKNFCLFVAICWDCSKTHFWLRLLLEDFSGGIDRKYELSKMKNFWSFDVSAMLIDVWPIYCTNYVPKLKVAIHWKLINYFSIANERITFEWTCTLHAEMIWKQLFHAFIHSFNWSFSERMLSRTFNWLNLNTLLLAMEDKKMFCVIQQIWGMIEMRTFHC